MSVKSRALAFMNHGQQVFAKSVVHPPAKQRAFMGPSVEDFLPTIREQLDRAIRDTFRE